jgi:hypothetical protein
MRLLWTGPRMRGPQSGACAALASRACAAGALRTDRGALPPAASRSLRYAQSLLPAATPRTAAGGLAQDGGSSYAGGRPGSERVASLRAEQRTGAEGRRLPQHEASRNTEGANE